MSDSISGLQWQGASVSVAEHGLLSARDATAAHLRAALSANDGRRGLVERPHDRAGAAPNRDGRRITPGSLPSTAIGLRGPLDRGAAA